MNLPIHDWQFWVVTGLFAGAVVWLVRGLLPRARRKRKQRRAVLTVEGEQISKSAKQQSSKGP